MSSDGDTHTLLYVIIDRLFGKDHLVQVREDFKWIAYNKVERFQRWNPNPQFLKQEALNAKEGARSSKWDQIGFVFGITLSVLSIFFVLPLNPLPTLVGMLISILTALRRVAVTMVLYNNPYRIYDDRQLKFACAWNRAMNGWTSLSVMPLGLLVRITPDKYKLGLWVLENEIEDKYK